jgi:hypothetical protein
VSEPPLECSFYTQALNNSFYASKVGIDVKVDLLTVLQILPLYRPYKKYKDVTTVDHHDFDDYTHQITMVFNLIHVLSNNGELRLSPGLFPQEVEFLVNPEHMERAVRFRDVHLVGEICHCLRVFGVSEATYPHIRTGLDFLRSSQILSDGSWPARDDSDVPYHKYAPTPTHAIRDKCQFLILNMPNSFSVFFLLCFSSVIYYVCYGV